MYVFDDSLARLTQYLCVVEVKVYLAEKVEFCVGIIRELAPAHDRVAYAARSQAWFVVASLCMEPPRMAHVAWARAILNVHHGHKVFLFLIVVVDESFLLLVRRNHVYVCVNRNPFNIWEPSARVAGHVA